MFSIARSRLALVSQFLFLAVNAAALLLGLIYNRKTPDLYENSIHGKIGWAMTWVASAWVMMAVVDAYASRMKLGGIERHAVNDLNAANMAQYQRVQDMQASSLPRWSNDSGQGTERNSSSLCGHSRSPSVESEQEHFLNAAHRYPQDDDDDEAFDVQTEKRGFLRDTAVNRFLSRNAARFVVGKPLRILRVIYVLIERTILIQGFAAIASGTIVYGGIAVSIASVSGQSGRLTKSCSTEVPSSTSWHTT